MKEASYLSRKLENWFDKHERVVTALSGGIDSSLVAFMSRKILGKDHAIAVVSASASLKHKDLLEVRQFAKAFDITLCEINSKEMVDPNYIQNPVNRCFYCKTALYSEVQALLKKAYKGYTLLNGNNYGDLSDYRPGHKAAHNFKVLSPLAECGFTKEDIRTLAWHYQLPNWNKPASPCLSSRFPYGESITPEKLRQVEQAEELLNDMGFSDVRVRYRKNHASIEVPHTETEKLEEHIERIAPRIKEFGFDSCTIDPEGLVSGKLNRGINPKYLGQ